MHRCLSQVGGWQKHSFIDYPGTVATVLFFCGCNLRCPFCHNPSLVLNTVEERPDPEDIIAYLKKRQGIIEGVVLSGGEPTIHPTIFDLARELRMMGLKIKLDSNGMLPDVTERVAPDYFALDIKTVPQRYGMLLAAPYADVERRLVKSIEQVRLMGTNAEIRITAAPTCVDEDMVREIGRLLTGVSKIYLQPMKQNVPLLDPRMEKTAPDSMEVLEQYRKILGEIAETCKIRGS